MSLHDKVRKNEELGRYELTVAGSTALVTYDMRDGKIALTHTEVPGALTGQGVGSELAKGTLDDIRAQGLKVLPICTFIEAYIKRHPEYQDLVG
ncbi:GNAT family N-acetyltransferase [Azospirillum sp. A26]|uniref:GNAT family N-acetyltransferase n=1 Tax=unclassified Azospirillum TaxID=2630922 RepID=UPI000D606884|nr:GNAT family N-acetyltransferase [Azospirillum sp. TSH64]PWC79639.1 acetyltransferase [Azospirillum sp. TSH64]